MDPDDVTAEVWAQTRQTLPLPGAGDTATRFDILAGIAARDLCVAKLVEPHFDATAILAELGGDLPDPQSLWAVWAAEPPHARVRATRQAGSWRLAGTKAFCSGAAMVSHALVTADSDDGARLFAIDVAAARGSGQLTLAAADWVGPGMRRAGTRTVDLRELPAVPVGVPGEYVDRPGFWHGAAGVAACWLGGARAVTQRVVSAAVRRPLDAHALAHLGAMTATLAAAAAHLSTTAKRIDSDPADLARQAQRDAQSVRATIVAAAECVIDRTAHALGPAPLAFDAEHAQRVADLAVFIRQHHGERDLAELGRLVVAAEGGRT